MSHSASTELAASAGLPEDRYPETLEEADMVTNILADAMNKLSLDEHEKIIFDIHGMGGALYPDEEDPNYLPSKMKELEERLAHAAGNKTYLEALRLNSAYVEKYRRVYLIAERFDIESAAALIIQQFDVKKELFGDGSILVREIRQSDLSARAKAVLESGMMQTSTVRDSAGRTVLFMTSEYDHEDMTITDLGQAIYYYGMSTMQDEETLRNGLVWVFYNLNSFEISKEMMDPLYRVEKSLPARISAVHYCFNDEAMLPFVRGMQLFFAEHDRVRTLAHCGTLEEIQFKLQTFGVPTEAGPLKMDGSWSLTWLHEWLRSQRLREGKEEQAETNQTATRSAHDLPQQPESQENQVIAVPGRFDVIIGKTSQARMHTGNRRAIHLCDMYFEKYENASKFHKTEVAETIVSIIRQSGGRFIRWEDDEGWIEEKDELVARKKISHFLRYMRSKVKNGTSKASAPKRPSEGTVEDEHKSVAPPIRVTPPSSPKQERAAV